MGRSLVVGAGGLLGQSVTNELILQKPATELICPVVTWRERSVAESQLTAAVERWLDSDDTSPRELYWCAGIGTPRSNPQHLVDEQSYLQHVLRVIEAKRDADQRSDLRIFFASSAGGIYGNTAHSIATESTAPQPMNEYGWTKLRLEDLLHDFAARVGATVIIGRISSLYGSQQNLTKRQGLISHLAYSLARALPIQIFTSPSTTRNYLDAASAARVAIFQTRNAAYTGIRLRNICAPFNSSVAELISLSRQISGRRLIVNYVGGETPDDSRIATEFPAEVGALTRTTLAEGLAGLVASARQSLAARGA
jgi:UDP-glucose 4-epimerase